MTSPFPGMDPWLEGYLWSDVHQDLSSAIKALLAPQIAPKYVARLALATILDNSPESEIGIMYPDVEIMQRYNMAKEPMAAYGGIEITEPYYITPFKLPISVRIPIVEIRDAANNKLITAIEILPPVNKRLPNLTDYQDKIINLHRNGVHIVEIDLLRRGTRPFSYQKTSSNYQMTLLRAGTQNAEIWAVNIQDKLPVLPIPLRSPDADVSLDLGKALDIIFERSLYHLSIDYNKTPPPPIFSEQDSVWMQQIIDNQ
jgi:Protein of unknown function (DUF4058)